jgi:hypothetical protein
MYHLVAILTGKLGIRIFVKCDDFCKFRGAWIRIRESQQLIADPCGSALYHENG